jgi:hypothetical protein
LNQTLKAEQLDIWKQNQTGALTTLGINQIAFLRIPDDSDIFHQFPDPSAGKNSPHIELAMGVRLDQTFPDETLADAPHRVVWQVSSPAIL